MIGHLILLPSILVKHNSIERLHQFLAIPVDCSPLTAFEPLNIAGKVTAWNMIKHPLKIASTHQGKIDKTLY